MAQSFFRIFLKGSYIRIFLRYFHFLMNRYSIQELHYLSKISFYNICTQRILLQLMLLTKILWSMLCLHLTFRRLLVEFKDLFDYCLLKFNFIDYCHLDWGPRLHHLVLSKLKKLNLLDF